MAEKTPTKTPTKTIEFLSPSAENLCVLSCCDITEKYKDEKSSKTLLWDSNGNQTNAGLQLEDYLDITLNSSTDLKCICRNCIGKVRNNITKSCDT